MKLWTLFKQFCNIARTVQFHKPSSVVENDSIKMLCDFNIQKDHVIQHKRADPNVLYKTQRKCHLIDIALLGDKRIELKE